jgi:two-component system alkaline phosphatase synthesis response regulator PhoP
MTDKILVVDDEPDILNLAKRILEGPVYQVITASDGDQALRTAETEVPDIILLDVVMPGKSGLEVCKILKSQAKTKHIPVVMFTALGRDIDRKLTAEAGSCGHFIKPFTSEALLTDVKTQLDQARMNKFSSQLGFEHDKLRGKKILLEFDPSTRYERFIRDFALESASHNEAVIILTKKRGAIQLALEGEAGIEIIEVKPDMMLSPILDKYQESSSLSLVYDSLTDLALSQKPQVAYMFAQSALNRLVSPTITALFLLNPEAHDSKEVYSLRGIFNDHVTYGKQGATVTRAA